MKVDLTLVTHTPRVPTYRTLMEELRVGHDQQIPDEPQRVVGRKRGKQIHVEGDAGALQGPVEGIQDMQTA